MAEGSLAAKKPEGGAAASQVEALFQRRIEFHRARKPYSSFSGADGDFRLETLNPSSGPDRPATSSGGAAAAVASSPGKRSGQGEFYEHGLDPELSFRITFRRIGAGLANLGNTCFLNSVLQCLTYTEPFAAYLQSGKHKSSCRTAGFCAMCALQNHVITALQSSGKILSPSHLVKNLRCISRNFRNSRQEDAHEYMVNLLESMHKCCLPSGVPSESPSAYEKSLVHKIFGGRLRSQVKCMQCSYSSSKFDPFLDLSLEIAKADSLRKALAHFTAVEQLDGGQRQYQCQHCKQKVRALKQLTIHKAPYVLNIHLKRFGSHVPGQKIDKKVDFEPSLDLRPFISDQHGSDLKYTLYGVLVHAGWSTHSGHYYCYVRTSSGMWHSLDDNQVRQVSEKTVLAQKAYMLFYVRDRSSIPKGSVNKAFKDNISANAIGKNLIPELSLQNNVMETKLSTLESISANARTYIANIQFGSADTSSHNTLPQTASTLQKHDKTALKEVPELQNSSQIIRTENSALQAGYFLSKRFQQTTSTSGTLSKEPMRPPVATILQEANKASMVEEAISEASHENGSPFILESVKPGSERCHACNSKGEDKSGVLVAQPNYPGCLGPKSQKHENKLLEQREITKNGSAANGIVQISDILCNTASFIPEENGKFGILSQSNRMNGFTKKEETGNAPAGNLVTHHDGRCLSNLQSHADDIPKQEKPILVDFSKRLGRASSFVQKESSEENGKIDNPMELKAKKLTKFRKKGLHFGRNHLFLASLSLRMIKKSKKSKKHSRKRCLGSKNSLEDHNITINDQSTSTSEATKNVAVGRRSHLEHSHSGLIKDNSADNVKSGNYCNGESLNATDREEVNNTKNAKPGPFDLPGTCLSSAEKFLNSRVTDTDGKILPQHDFVKMLMGGLKETTVPRWDDVELPKLELNGLESSRNTTIGYVLDEWDEEYDTGKRKKLRKSLPSFDGPNPFQETANLKAQQKSKSRLEQTRLGNQPLRI